MGARYVATATDEINHRGAAYLVAWGRATSSDENFSPLKARSQLDFPVELRAMPPERIWQVVDEILSQMPEDYRRLAVLYYQKRLPLSHVCKEAMVGETTAKRDLGLIRWGVCFGVESRKT